MTEDDIPSRAGMPPGNPGHFCDQGRFVINLACAHDLVAVPGKAAGVAARHGLVGLTKTAAVEVVERGATATASRPGHVRTLRVERPILETAHVRGIPEAEVRHDMLPAAQPTRALATPGPLGAVAAVPCRAATAQVTGAAPPVDGGWTAR